MLPVSDLWTWQLFWVIFGNFGGLVARLSSISAIFVGCWIPFWFLVVFFWHPFFWPWFWHWLLIDFCFISKVFGSICHWLLIDFRCCLHNFSDTLFNVFWKVMFQTFFFFHFLLFRRHAFYHIKTMVLAHLTPSESLNSILKNIKKIENPIKLRSIFASNFH